jgi:HD superfamily phosphohydrolase
MIKHLARRFKKDESGYEFREEADQKLRFAALLHDIGHVPLSHVGEVVLKDVAEEKLKAERRARGRKIDAFAFQGLSWRLLFPEETYLGNNTKLHEQLSAEMVLYNDEIDEVLKMVWPDPKQREKAKKSIAQVIVGKDETHVPTLLLHSELDADRLDYLLRDSFFTGVGYGKIELDYIISRLCIHRDKDGVAILCVEDKGLHTIEHFILGRFFLQTQVVYNRKVRLMDLLFADVLKYMVKAGEKQKRGIMNLQQFRGHIQNSRGETKRKHLHKIYRYTDAEVFNKMRQLHETLDEKEKKRKTTPKEERYINDCIKIIMGGPIDEPLIPAQKIVNLEQHPNYKEELKKEGNKIAEALAKDNNIYPERIKVNVEDQEVMKYRKRREAEDNPEEVNREAVKIRDKTGTSETKIRCVAESNATILRDLHDKALLILNIYYIHPKSKTDANKDRQNKEDIEKTIKQAFGKFLTKHFKGDTPG